MSLLKTTNCSELSSLKRYESWTSHSSEDIYPVATTKFFVSPILNTFWEQNYSHGHYTILRNPVQTFSVFEAAFKGCELNQTATVEHAAKQRGCVVAQNAGFFGQSSGACYGDIVSDGNLVRNADDFQDVNFGVTEDGRLLTGPDPICLVSRSMRLELSTPVVKHVKPSSHFLYFSQDEKKDFKFLQLMSGIVWLVRNGSSYIEKSVRRLKEKTILMTAGGVGRFVDMFSARSVIGHDRQGRVVFVHVDGQTELRGINLKGLSRYLIEHLDIVNAINLDGGGSTTLVVNDTLISYTSDVCIDNSLWRCPRAVSTVICAHEPYCDPACKNGRCVAGKCDCFANWQGEACEILSCGVNNCSEHGVCTSTGCLCFPRWYGDQCQFEWQSEHFGIKHSCAESSGFDSASGHCRHDHGFSGALSDQMSQCLAKTLQKEFLDEGKNAESSTLRIPYILGTVLFVSVSFNLMLLWKLYMFVPDRRKS